MKSNLSQLAINNSNSHCRIFSDIYKIIDTFEVP